MKKMNIFSALTLCLLAPAISNAQMWSGGGASTYTKDNVGIGVSTAPTAADPKLPRGKSGITKVR